MGAWERGERGEGGRVVLPERACGWMDRFHRVPTTLDQTRPDQTVPVFSKLTFEGLQCVRITLVERLGPRGRGVDRWKRRDASGEEVHCVWAEGTRTRTQTQTQPRIHTHTHTHTHGYLHRPGELFESLGMPRGLILQRRQGIPEGRSVLFKAGLGRDGRGGVTW